MVFALCGYGSPTPAKFRFRQLLAASMSRYLLQTYLGSFWQNAPTLDNYNTSIVLAALVAPTTAASASACSSVCFTPTALPSLAIRSCTCGIAPHASHLGHQGFLVFLSSRGPLGSG
ncbi:hypothetical protein AAFF_G00198080 [Aldrovandia affinis]|uniref:Uncharacterized protein n=1 Tax=Aldrovandia affinis TaxID=143900 RepID=A0AAD7W5B1_9TELE|nr:hypothetical protein AAFF_G00198080 [Aldrovandia affinis]